MQRLPSIIAFSNPLNPATLLYGLEPIAGRRAWLIETPEVPKTGGELLRRLLSRPFGATFTSLFSIAIEKTTHHTTNSSSDNVGNRPTSLVRGTLHLIPSPATR